MDSTIEVTNPLETPPLPPQIAQRYRILHISDLHFGARFQQGNWTSLKTIARDLQPDLVVVTGDLVNTPWWWMLKKANRELKELLVHLARPEAPLKLRLIPGNHDTRISGVFPVAWLLPLAILLGAAAIALALCTWSRPTDVPFWHRWSFYGMLVPGILTLVAAGLRACVRTDLSRYFPDFLLRDPEILADDRIGIVPLDSATRGLSWARGYVTPEHLASARSGITKADLQPVPTRQRRLWIALVHHHPLPLPYNSVHEQMMVMDNAGSVLAELSRAGVQLILHGHKHHQHFARISINHNRRNAAQMAVLSAGTPTEGRNAGAFWHGFNVIDLANDGDVKIRMYNAPPEGGSFDLEQEFDFLPMEQQDETRYREGRKLGKVWCRRLMCLADIDAFGDVTFYREFRGVGTDREQLSQLPDPFASNATSGLIEAFVVKGLSGFGPQIQGEAEYPTVGRCVGTVKFGGSGLQRGEAPIDFQVRVQANNALALNRWQFECMYPARGREFRESVAFRMPEQLAVEELMIHVQFPDEAPLPQRLDLRMSIGTPERSRPFPAQSLVRIDAQNLVQVRIAYPVAGALYMIDWGLPEADDVAPAGRARGIARALHLRGALAALSPETAPDDLKDALSNIEEQARGYLGRADEKLHIALFTFDAATCTARYLVGNHDDADVRRKGAYPFGLGLPGRAFKAGTTISFRRPVRPPAEQAWGYIHPDGHRVSDQRKVPEAAIVAIPLAPLEAPDWPYGVLQISTDDPTHILKTENSPSDNTVEQFSAALREFTPEFEGMMRRPSEEHTKP